MLPNGHFCACKHFLLKIAALTHSRKVSELFLAVALAVFTKALLAPGKRPGGCRLCPGQGALPEKSRPRPARPKVVLSVPHSNHAC